MPMYPNASQIIEARKKVGPLADCWRCLTEFAAKRDLDETILFGHMILTNPIFTMCDHGLVHACCLSGSSFQEEEKRWFRPELAGAVMAAYSLCLVYDLKGEVEDQARFIFDTFEHIRIVDSDNEEELDQISFSIAFDGLDGLNWDWVMKNVLARWLRVYYMARKIQRAFHEYKSKKRIQARNNIIKQELMETVWHPSNSMVKLIFEDD
jgi:hypothetical protein